MIPGKNQWWYVLTIALLSFSNFPKHNIYEHDAGVACVVGSSHPLQVAARGGLVDLTYNYLHSKQRGLSDLFNPSVF